MLHPSLTSRRFSSTEACAAAMIDAATFKNWVSREPSAILLSEQDRAARDGRGSFQLSFNRVMQIALLAELVRLGFQPRQAGMLAAGFTDVGDVVSGWSGETPAVARLPGELYPHGYTVMVAHPGSEMSELHNVIPGEGAFDPFFLSARGSQTSTAVVNVTSLMWQVLVRLGFDRNGEPLKP